MLILLFQEGHFWEFFSLINKVLHPEQTAANCSPSSMTIMIIIILVPFTEPKVSVQMTKQSITMHNKATTPTAHTKQDKANKSRKGEMCNWRAKATLNSWVWRGFTENAHRVPEGDGPQHKRFCQQRFQRQEGGIWMRPVSKEQEVQDGVCLWRRSVRYRGGKAMEGLVGEDEDLWKWCWTY